MDTQTKFETLIRQAASTREKLFYAGLRLFAHKGYANVGIRELCRMIGIKESSFYNHYQSKDDLLCAILAYFGESSSQIPMNDVELHALIEQGDIHMYFVENMKRCSTVLSNVLYRSALQIVLAERFIHPIAAEMAKKNIYYLQRADTEQVLRGMMESGAIRQCDAEAVTAEYYYALKSILDEYLMSQLWENDCKEIQGRIYTHIEFFSSMLAVPPKERQKP